MLTLVSYLINFYGSCPDTELVLDPYLLNVFPRSLVPTAAYIVLLAIGGYYLSISAWKHVESFLDSKEHAD